MDEKRLAEIRQHIKDVESCGVEGTQAKPVDQLTSDAWDLLAEVAAIKEDLATKTRWAEQVERQFFTARAEAERLKEWFSYAEETIHGEFCSGEHPEGFCTRARP